MLLLLIAEKIEMKKTIPISLFFFVNSIPFSLVSVVWVVERTTLLNHTISWAYESRLFLWWVLGNITQLFKFCLPFDLLSETIFLKSFWRMIIKFKNMLSLLVSVLETKSKKWSMSNDSLKRRLLKYVSSKIGSWNALLPCFCSFLTIKTEKSYWRIEPKRPSICCSSPSFSQQPKEADVSTQSN